VQVSKSDDFGALKFALSAVTRECHAPVFRKTKRRVVVSTRSHRLIRTALAPISAPRQPTVIEGCWYGASGR
jgi:hypothetical protein